MHTARAMLFSSARQLPVLAALVRVLLYSVIYNAIVAHSKLKIKVLQKFSQRERIIYEKRENGQAVFSFLLFTSADDRLSWEHRL